MVPLSVWQSLIFRRPHQLLRIWVDNGGEEREGKMLGKLPFVYNVLWDKHSWWQFIVAVELYNNLMTVIEFHSDSMKFIRFLHLMELKYSKFVFIFCMTIWRFEAKLLKWAFSKFRVTFWAKLSLHEKDFVACEFEFRRTTSNKNNFNLSYDRIHLVKVIDDSTLNRLTW